MEKEYSSSVVIGGALIGIATVTGVAIGLYKLVKVLKNKKD